MGIIGIAWLLVIVGSFMIFYLIVPIDIFLGKKDYVSIFLNSFLKVVLSAILAFLWIVVMVRLRNVYIERKLSD